MDTPWPRGCFRSAKGGCQISEQLTILYIGSFGRSGSTLLGQMLGQIPGFFSAGELRHVWDRSFQENQLCGCGQAFYSCEFWNAVGQEAFGGLKKINPNEVLAMKRSIERHRHIPYHVWATKTGKYRRKMPSHLAEYGALLERWYRAIQNISGARVIIDSSKDPPYAFLLNAFPFVDLRLLRLVRDSRAVAYSWSRQRVRPEISSSRVLMPRFGPLKSSYLWNMYNYSLNLLSKVGPLSAWFRYEDLSRDPASCIREVLDELKLGEVDQLPFINGQKLKLDVHHTVSGNPMRFQSGAIEVRPDEEWRSEMKAIDRGIVSAVTLDLLLRYGYFDSSKRVG